MPDKGMVIIADYSQGQELNIDELMDYLHLRAEFIEGLIDFGIVQPQGKSANEWIFDDTAIKRIQQAKRLHRDLEINLAGIATILDLLDEVRELRKHAELIERHFFK